MNLSWFRRDREEEAMEQAVRENLRSMEFLDLTAHSPTPVDPELLRSSIRVARALAQAESVRAAWMALPERLRAEVGAGLFGLKGRFCLAVRCGSLLTLAMIVRLVADGWRILVEDCRFSQAYLARFLAREGGELCALSRMPAHFTTLHEAGNQERWVFVTFVDRPLGTYDGTVLLNSGLGAFYMSDADALMAELPFDQVLPAAIGLESGPMAVAEGATLLAGRLADKTGNHFQVLSGEINGHPEEYLAWRQLAARSQKFQRRVAINGRAIFKSLLLHTKVHGHCRDAGACDEVLRAIGRLQKTC